VSTASLNVLDELYLHLDREEEPWSVQLEVGVESRVDAARLRDAIISGAGRHPLARARLSETRVTDVRYRWEIADRLETAPLEVVDCDDDAALAAARERLMASSPALDTIAPFAVTLAHHSDGDAIMLNLNHAAGDGMSALRLMASFLRAYAGEEDPAAPVDPLDVRDIGTLVESRSLSARLGRSRALLQRAADVFDAPARIAPDGASGRAGYGFELLHLDSAGLRTVLAHRRDGATANDVLLGALAVTVHRWNEQHGTHVGRIALMMPINLRPAAWRFDVVGNFASYVSVALPADASTSLLDAVAAARSRTQEIKAQGAAGAIVDLLELPTATLPTVVKQRFQNLIKLTGDRYVDTAVLSNLGRLEEVPNLGEHGGAVRRVWFSPPGRMPLGASLGAATYRDELFLTLRYRHAQFDAPAATAFADLLRTVLTTDPDEASS
jgi:NRPS condensation-like uncharacterized protein